MINLETLKPGDRVRTRNGLVAVFIGKGIHHQYPYILQFEVYGDVGIWRRDGRWFSLPLEGSDKDIINIIQPKVTAWVVFWKGGGASVFDAPLKPNSFSGDVEAVVRIEYEKGQRDE